MRIGCVYAPRKDWPKWQWVCAALSRIGHDVTAVTDVSQLAKANEECDLLLFEHRDCGVGRRHVRDLAPKKRCQWAQWWFDLFAIDQSIPLAETNNWKLLGETMQCFDRVFVKEADRIGEYRELGVKAEYMDQGCPSWWPMLQFHEKPAYDVVVFGSSDPQFYRERIKAAEEIAANGYRVAWATAQGTVPKGVERLPWHHPNDLNGLMSQAWATLCIDVRSDIRGYWSDRHWLVRGAGAIPLTINDPMNMLKIAKGMCLEERIVASAAIRNEVMEHHTYEHRVTAIIDRLRSKYEGLSSLSRHQDGEMPHEGALQNGTVPSL